MKPSPSGSPRSVMVTSAATDILSPPFSLMPSLAEAIRHGRCRSRLLGGGALLAVLMCCWAAAGTRSLAASGVAIVTVGSGCPSTQLSFPQRFHVGAQVHNSLRLQECRIQLRRSSIESSSAMVEAPEQRVMSEACEAQRVGPLERFHLGAHVHALLRQRACINAVMVGV